MITEQAYKQAAQSIGCDVASIKAVSEVESMGDGFLNGEPKILFERHVFSRRTNGKFDKSHPSISNPSPGGYGKYSEQHERLQEASALDRDAALQSASWGRFQIMGFNYKSAGFNTLQEFINAMYKSEDEHLNAFVNFIKSQGLSKYLIAHKWVDFAKGYNGPSYAKNSYDTKLAEAYRKYAGL